MSGFIETPRFPEFVSAWAIGGRGFKTSIVETDGGNEYRNAQWSLARGTWQVQNAWMSANPQNNVFNWKATRNMFMVARGRLNAFRFKDPLDYSDEGAGVFVQLTPTTFQMYKNYAIAPLSYAQIIQKPVVGTVVVTGGVSPVVDYTTGIVTVSSGTPGSWTGQFDVPVRFDDDMPANGLDESTGALMNWQTLKLVEVRNP
jgi:uncharacterized protein (TIGR02217 family)